MIKGNILQVLFECEIKVKKNSSFIKIPTYVFNIHSSSRFILLALYILGSISNYVKYFSTHMDCVSFGNPRTHDSDLHPLLQIVRLF